MTKQVGIIEKLRETSHHSTLSQSQNMPSLSNGKRRKSNEVEGPHGDYLVSGDESDENASQSEYGEYQDDTQRTAMGTDFNDEEEDDIVVDSDVENRYTPEIPPNNTPTPSRKRRNQATPKIKNNQEENQTANQNNENCTIYYPDEDSETEHLDPPRDDIPAAYSSNGEICPDLPRLIIKSVGKIVLGRNHMVGVMLRGPRGKKYQNQEIWVCTTHYYILNQIIFKGFFKLTMMDGDTVIRDGHKDVSLLWEYCGFSSGNYTIWY
jgi:hypothetical protein